MTAYRIRYLDQPGQGKSETIIEANNPTEAMVKFQHTMDRSDLPKAIVSRVISISPESPNAPDCE